MVNAKDSELVKRGRSNSIRKSDFKVGSFDSAATKASEVNENEWVTKGPVTLENDIIYTGEWMNGVRDGQGS